MNSCLQLTTKLNSGGLVGDHERYNAATALLSKGLEERPAAYNCYDPGHGGGEEIQTSGTNIRSHQVSQALLASSSPRSCITTSLGSNMLDFSNTTVPPAPDLKNHHSDNSSEVSNNKKNLALQFAAYIYTCSSFFGTRPSYKIFIIFGSCIMLLQLGS
jgi:hypothetical protein